MNLTTTFKACILQGCGDLASTTPTSPTLLPSTTPTSPDCANRPKGADSKREERVNRLSECGRPPFGAQARELVACLGQLAIARNGAAHRRRDEARVPLTACEEEDARLLRHTNHSEEFPAKGGSTACCVFGRTPADIHKCYVRAKPDTIYKWCARGSDLVMQRHPHGAVGTCLAGEVAARTCFGLRLPGDDRGRRDRRRA